MHTNRCSLRSSSSFLLPCFDEVAPFNFDAGQVKHIFCCSCLESCYWHLIEKRFCYDESIALYEVPEKEEKNNNFFDNMAFYDSVSVIAGRAVVTIDPLPEEKPIIQQPTSTRKLRWESDDTDIRGSFGKSLHMSKSVPAILQRFEEEEDEKKVREKENTNINKETPKMGNHENKSEAEVTQKEKPKMETLKIENLEGEVEVRRKSLKDRRMSKSLYLKIEQPKELPLVRQQSMPKFYLDTPDEHGATYARSPSTTLTSPVPSKPAFVYDLYSVVQMERERVQSIGSHVPVHRKESDRAASRILQIRDKIRLRRVKSSLGTPVTNLPHSHHHI